MLVMFYGNWTSLRRESALAVSRQLAAAPLVGPQEQFEWRRRLAAIVSHPSEKQVRDDISAIIGKALGVVVKKRIVCRTRHSRSRPCHADPPSPRRDRRCRRRSLWVAGGLAG